MEIIKAESLSKYYGEKNTRVEALKNINLTIKKGEFIAIMGASGSGKSTLLHLLGGIENPSLGKVYIEGIDLYKMDENQRAVFRRRKIGFVFQNFNLLPVLTVEENIILPLLLDKKVVDRDYIDGLLNILKLDKRRDSLPNQLSGGQQQRVAIGRALSYNPSIILADEPTGNLDSETSKEIMDLLKISIKKYNQTLVVITHDINIASQADRIIRIEDGEILEFGAAENERL